MTTERVLIHGPRLDDLTELLYFDRIVYPTTTAIRRPRDLPPGYAGYPVEEPFREAVLEKLAETGFTTSAGQLLFTPSAEYLADSLLSGTDPSLAAIEWSTTNASALAEIAFAFLDTPASPPEVDAWLREIDCKTKRLAAIALARGRRAVPKYFARDVTRTLRPGWNVVLSVVFPQFPGLDMGRANLDALIAFLSDDETRDRRRALFDWSLDVEGEVESGRVTIETVPDRIAESLDGYIRWIVDSGLPLRPAVAEFLLVFGPSFIERLAALELSEGTGQMLVLSARGLSLTAEEAAASGRELAYLCHGQRGYGE